VQKAKGRFTDSNTPFRFKRKTILLTKKRHKDIFSIIKQKKMSVLLLHIKKSYTFALPN